jgi:hypothetical protein
MALLNVRLARHASLHHALGASAIRGEDGGVGRSGGAAPCCKTSMPARISAPESGSAVGAMANGWVTPNVAHAETAGMLCDASRPWVAATGRLRGSRGADAPGVLSVGGEPAGVVASEPMGLPPVACERTELAELRAEEETGEDSGEEAPDPWLRCRGMPWTSGPVPKRKHDHHAPSDLSCAAFDSPPLPVSIAWAGLIADGDEDDENEPAEETGLGWSEGPAEGGGASKIPCSLAAVWIGGTGGPPPLALLPPGRSWLLAGRGAPARPVPAPCEDAGDFFLRAAPAAEVELPGPELLHRPAAPDALLDAGCAARRNEDEAPGPEACATVAPRGLTARVDGERGLRRLAWDPTMTVDTSCSCFLAGRPACSDALSGGARGDALLSRGFLRAAAPSDGGRRPRLELLPFRDDARPASMTRNRFASPRTSQGLRVWAMISRSTSEPEQGFVTILRKYSAEYTVVSYHTDTCIISVYSTAILDLLSTRV